MNRPIFGLIACSLAAATAAGPARAPAAEPPDLLGVQRPAGVEWFGIYVLGRKAGWSTTRLGVEERGGRKVFAGRAHTTVKATLGERDVVREADDEKVFEARPRGRLLAFTARRAGDGGERLIEGRCDPKACTVAITGDGPRDERKIPLPRETAEDADAARVVARRGGTRRGFQLDLDRLREKEVETRVVRRDRVAAAGVEIPVTIVEEREVGDRAATTTTVADDGRILEVRVGDSVAAKAEPEAVAKRLDRVDLFGLTRVKLDAPLPQGVPAILRYRFRGLPARFAADDPRQRVEARGEETIVTVTAALPAAADPARDPKRAGAGALAPPELLEATAEVDADAPAIRRLAKELVRDTPGTYAAARRIAEAVNLRLEKTYGSSRDRASEVLAAGKGDCTEHTLLFVALARAAGVPARPVHGLVYSRYQDGVHALYWHAWPEVLAGGEWIALDPTFGQPVADATHVALGRGSQVDTVSLLGALSVAGVERLE
jgi:hypothetical protein